MDLQWAQACNLEGKVVAAEDMTLWVRSFIMLVQSTDWYYAATTMYIPPELCGCFSSQKERFRVHALCLLENKEKERVAWNIDMYIV